MAVSYTPKNPAAMIRRGLQVLSNRTVQEFIKNYKEHDELAEAIDKIPLNQILFYDEKPEEVELNRVIYVDGYFYRGAEDEETPYWNNIGKLLNDEEHLFIDTEEHWENLGVRPEGVLVYHTDTNKLWFWQDDSNKFLINDTEHPDGQWTVTDTINNNRIDWTIDFTED